MKPKKEKRDLQLRIAINYEAAVPGGADAKFQCQADLTVHENEKGETGMVHMSDFQAKADSATAAGAISATLEDLSYQAHVNYQRLTEDSCTVDCCPEVFLRWPEQGSLILNGFQINEVNT